MTVKLEIRGKKIPRFCAHFTEMQRKVIRNTLGVHLLSIAYALIMANMVSAADKERI